MKTYPLFKDGSLTGFEVSNTWITARGISKFLSQKNSVTDLKVKDLAHNDNRLEFNFKGQNFIVNEPFGDSDVYWIYPAEFKTSLSQTEELEVIFKELKPAPSKIILAIVAGLILLWSAIDIVSRFSQRW